MAGWAGIPVVHKLAWLVLALLCLLAIVYGVLNWQGEHGRLNMTAILLAIAGVLGLKSVLFSLWMRTRRKS